MNLFVDAIQLDVAHINFVWGRNGAYFKTLLKRNGVIKESFRHLFRTARSIIEAFRSKRPSYGPARALFFADSLNQYRALLPVKERVQDGVFGTDRDLPGELRFPAWLARLISFIFVPVLLVRTLQGRIPAWSLGYGLSDYLDAYGYFFVGALWLRKLRPRVLILSNGHSAQTRAIQHAARRYRIPCVYLQHAPVTSEFPPLDFDCAFLDGLDSLKKYQIANPMCKIFLAGNSRRPRVESTKTRTEAVMTIGLAFTDDDPEIGIRRVVAEAKVVFPGAEIKIRPHPADRRQTWFLNFSASEGCQFSNPKKEMVWTFLSGLDILVSGTSGISLDAAFMGVIPFQHLEISGDKDPYGLRESGLVRLISSFHEIRDISHRKKEVWNDVRTHLKDHDATYETGLDGQSDEIIASVLESEFFGVPAKYPNYSECRRDYTLIYFSERSSK